MNGTLKFVTVNNEPAIELADARTPGESPRRFKLDGTEIVAPEPDLGKPVALIDFWTDDWCGVPYGCIFTASNSEHWKTLCRKLADVDRDMPEDRIRDMVRGGVHELTTLPSENDEKADFTKVNAVVICDGASQNSNGYTHAGTWENTERILIRVEMAGYQSGGRFGGGVPTRGYAVIIVPRTDKRIVVETNMQGYIGGPPKWSSIFDITKLDPATELKALDDAEKQYQERQAVKQVSIPERFAREVKHYSGDKLLPEDPNSEFPWGDRYKVEYDYFVDAKGRNVPHGSYKSFEIRDDKKVPQIEANYRDGKLHGRFVLYDTNGDFVEEERRYENGILNGPVTGRSEAGVVLRENYVRGRPEGKQEHACHEAGALMSVETWANDHRNGPATVFRYDGCKIMGEYRNGLKEGMFTVYSKDGKELGRFEMKKGTGTETFYDENGAKRFEDSLENGAVVLYRNIYQKSDTVVEIRYRHGSMHGQTKATAGQGKIIWDGINLFGRPWDGQCVFRGKGYKTYVSTFKDGVEVGPRIEVQGDAARMCESLPIPSIYGR
jgi:antitoxin component YwqK of YwqJK toxin-antitoxin module